MSKPPLGEFSENPHVQEHLIEAVEKNYGSYAKRRTQRRTPPQQPAA